MAFCAQNHSRRTSCAHRINMDVKDRWTSNMAFLHKPAHHPSRTHCSVPLCRRCLANKHSICALALRSSRLISLMPLLSSLRALANRSNNVFAAYSFSHHSLPRSHAFHLASNITLLRVATKLFAESLLLAVIFCLFALQSILRTHSAHAHTHARFGARTHARTRRCLPTLGSCCGYLINARTWLVCAHLCIVIARHVTSARIDSAQHQQPLRTRSCASLKRAWTRRRDAHGFIFARIFLATYKRHLSLNCASLLSSLPHQRIRVLITSS